MSFARSVLRVFPILLVLMLCASPRIASAYCGDYFSYEWNQPLDMNGPEDGPLNNVPVLEKRDVTAFSYANGIVSFNSTGTFPILTFLATLPYSPSIGQNGAIPVGSRYGEAHPIATSTYRYFVVRMYSNANTTGRVQWGMNANRYAVASFAVSAGWHTYEIDMNSVSVIPVVGSNLSWTAGNWQELQLYPGLASGVSFQVDYARLFTDPGCASVSTPSLTYIQPDQRGGKDFAQTVLGNSWNMNGNGDVALAQNYSSAQFLPNNAFTDSAGKLAVGDFFRMENITKNVDPAIYLTINAPLAQRINTQEYMNLCFAASNKVDAAGYNSVARVIYHDPTRSNSQEPYKVGDDILVSQGLHEYCMDLSNSIDARTEPNQPAGAPNPWTAVASRGGGVDAFRIDLNEEHEPFFGYLDYVHLRSEHQANSRFAIAVQAAVTDAVQLFYFPAAGGAEVSIGSMPSGRTTNIFKWDTSGVPAGKYRISSRIMRGGNAFFQKSPGRIDVNHGRAQDSTPPVLVCERPGANYSYNSTLEIAGYALDETRLAVVELLIDGAYFKSFIPDRFHLGARDAYPAWADSNNAGFQQLLDVSSLGRGNHSVTIRATDTAGNESSCSTTVVSRAGSNPAPLAYPPNNATPFTYSAAGGSGGVHPAVRVKIAAGSRVTYTISGTTGCSSVNLHAGSDSKLKNAVTIVTNASGGTIVASSAEVPAFKKRRGSREDGILYLMARCASGELSKKVKLDARHTGSRKKVRSEKKLLGYLRFHTQIGG